MCGSPQGHRESGTLVTFVNEQQQTSPTILFEVASYILCHLLLLAFPSLLFRYVSCRGVKLDLTLSINQNVSTGELNVNIHLHSTVYSV